MFFRRLIIWPKMRQWLEKLFNDDKLLRVSLLDYRRFVDAEKTFRGHRVLKEQELWAHLEKTFGEDTPKVLSGNEYHKRYAGRQAFLSLGRRGCILWIMILQLRRIVQVIFGAGILSSPIIPMMLYRSWNAGIFIMNRRMFCKQNMICLLTDRSIF